eukprot:jgi/Mesvir1/21774/Mv04173-RA.2
MASWRRARSKCSVVAGVLQTGLSRLGMVGGVHAEAAQVMTCEVGITGIDCKDRRFAHLGHHQFCTGACPDRVVAPSTENIQMTRSISASAQRAHAGVRCMGSRSSGVASQSHMLPWSVRLGAHQMSTVPVAAGIDASTPGVDISSATAAVPCDHHHHQRDNDDSNEDCDDVRDPRALVKDELDEISERMRSAVATETVIDLKAFEMASAARSTDRLVPCVGVTRCAMLQLPMLASAAEYFFQRQAQGKRLRPTILLLMAKSIPLAGDAGTMAHRRYCQSKIAEISEMIHVASLLHDDVIDKATTRRGVKSVNALLGNKLAILAGDFLLARASVSLAKLRNLEAVERLSTVIEHLVTGEIMQMSGDASCLNSIEHYLRKTYFKTASLVSNSAICVALFAEQDRHVAHAAGEFGKHLGLAYQLVDDILDFTGTSESLGKPACNDLNEGIATAPVLLASEEFQEMVPLISRNFKEEGDVQLALDLVKRSQGIARARQLALHHTELAVDAINALPDTTCARALKCRKALKHMASSLLSRAK